MQEINWNQICCLIFNEEEILNGICFLYKTNVIDRSMLGYCWGKYWSAGGVGEILSNICSLKKQMNKIKRIIEDVTNGLMVIIVPFDTIRPSFSKKEFFKIYYNNEITFESIFY